MIFIKFKKPTMQKLAGLFSVLIITQGVLVSQSRADDEISAILSTAKVEVAFPAPGKSISGLTYDGTHLWITLDGEPVIMKVNADTGEVLKRYPFVSEHTGGSAFDGKYLWQIAYLDRTISKIDIETGKIVETISTPGPGKTMSAGMTFDGEFLLVSNFDVGKIYKIDPKKSGKVIGTIDGSFETTGLAWDGRTYWNGILKGVTADHGMHTPVEGYVVNRSCRSSNMPNCSFPVNGVGPGTSSWKKGEPISGKFWWYDGINNNVVKIIIPPSMLQATVDPKMCW